MTNSQFNKLHAPIIEQPVALIPQDRLMTEKDVALRQGRSVKTLQNQRVTGGGIPFLKLGRSVRYRLTDVIAWEEANLRTSTSTVRKQ